MKIKMIMKKDHIISRPGRRHGHKYTKYNIPR